MVDNAEASAKFHDQDGVPPILELVIVLVELLNTLAVFKHTVFTVKLGIACPQTSTGNAMVSLQPLLDVTINAVVNVPELA